MSAIELFQYLMVAFIAGIVAGAYGAWWIESK